MYRCRFCNRLVTESRCTCNGAVEYAAYLKREAEAGRLNARHQLRPETPEAREEREGREHDEWNRRTLNNLNGVGGYDR